MLLNQVSHHVARGCIEGMANIGEVGAGADQLVLQFGMLEGLADQHRASRQFSGLFQLPFVQIVQTVDRGELAGMRRADRGAVLHLAELAQQFLAAGDGAGAKPGKAEHLRKTVQVDQRIAPVVAREQCVRRMFDIDEIAICLIDDQCQVVLARKLEKYFDALGAVDGAAGIVRGDQQQCASALVDQAARLVGIGHRGFGVERQVARDYSARRQPHLVIEVAGQGYDDFIVGEAQAVDDRAECLVATRGDQNVIGMDRALVACADVVRERLA